MANATFAIVCMRLLSFAINCVQMLSNACKLFIYTEIKKVYN
nr:MAG TPA: hypothetical protein [Caudoviricetes sp.]